MVIQVSLVVLDVDEDCERHIEVVHYNIQKLLLHISIVLFYLQILDLIVWSLRQIEVFDNKNDALTARVITEPMVRMCPLQIPQI